MSILTSFHLLRSQTLYITVARWELMFCLINYIGDHTEITLQHPVVPSTIALLLTNSSKVNALLWSVLLEILRVLQHVVKSQSRLMSRPRTVSVTIYM